MSNLKLKLQGPDLSSRYAAAEQRRHVVALLRNGDSVVVELTSVESISESYADELFGVLAAVYGLDWLRSNVKVEVSNEHVLRTIAVAIKKRLNETKTAPRPAKVFSPTHSVGTWR